MIIIVVVVGVVGIWLIRVRELGGLTDASQCRAIAENGLDVTVICQHLVYTGCASPAATTAVIPSAFSSWSYAVARKDIRHCHRHRHHHHNPHIPLLLLLLLVVLLLLCCSNCCVWELAQSSHGLGGGLTDASQCRVVAENGLDAAVDLSAS